MASKAVAVVHREAILERVRGGEILADIAKDYGVKKQSLHQVLQDDPEYQAAKRLQAASMIEEAKQETWAAREVADIARAREVARFAFRYAESVDTANWGQKKQLTITPAVPGEDRKLLEDASALLALVRKRGIKATNAVQHDVIDASPSDATSQAIDNK